MFKEYENFFDDSEKAHPIQEEEYIKIEKTKGKLIPMGIEDDALWDTAKCIRRISAAITIGKSFD